jgi:hypothetical protein
MNATTIHPGLDTYAAARVHDDQFLKCWRIQDCGSCVQSDDHCAWCPIVRPLLQSQNQSLTRAK